MRATTTPRVDLARLGLVNVNRFDLLERERAILLYRFFGELTQAEIAEKVGLSQMHVSRLLAQSLKTLRIELENSAEPAAQALPFESPTQTH